MININHSSLGEVQKRKYHAFIASSGFESRAIFQTSEFKGKVNKKYVFGFTNELDDQTRKSNDAFFKAQNFEYISLDGDTQDLAPFHSLLEEIIADVAEQEVRIYMDYSSMTRNWYANFLTVVRNKKTNKTINITFGYSHSKYLKAPEIEVLNRIVEPLYGYCSLSVPSKPTALIIGLGNEKDRVYGLKEYFDANSYLFYSDATFNRSFSEEVENVNYDILTSSKQEKIVKYPIYDLLYTSYLLENVCNVLLNDYRVIIAPCGPKPFTLLSLITSIKLNSLIEVWRISPGKALLKINREANGHVSLLDVTFTEEHL